MESGMTVMEWCHDREFRYYWLRIFRRKAVENTDRENADLFMELAKKYADFEELTPP